MATFRDSQQIYDTIGEVFKWIAAQKEITDKFRENGITLRFRYLDPDAEILVDARPDPLKLVFGPSPDVAEITMEMSSDTAHLFWLEKINLPWAVMTRAIRPTGPMPKVLKLLPLIKPAYIEYPRILHEKGLAHLTGGK